MTHLINPFVHLNFESYEEKGKDWVRGLEFPVVELGDGEEAGSWDGGRLFSEVSEEYWRKVFGVDNEKRMSRGQEATWFKRIFGLGWLRNLVSR